MKKLKSKLNKKKKKKPKKTKMTAKEKQLISTSVKKHQEKPLKTF